jgi:tetratricopeptide (TPR) repeat protein
MRFKRLSIIMLCLLAARVVFACAPLSGALLEKYQGVEFKSDIVPIQYMPVSLLPTGIGALEILPVFGNNREVEGLELIGVGNNGNPYDFGGLDFSGNYNPAKTDSFYDQDEGLVEILSQQPFSALYYGAKYRWDQNSQQLLLLEEWSDDPSAKAVEQVHSLLEQGLIAEAEKVLMGIFYPGNYYNDYEMAALFMDSAHKAALERYEAGDIEGAVGLMEEGFNVFADTIGNDWYMQFTSAINYARSDYSKYLSTSTFLVDINDYGFFLEQANHTAEAITVLREVLLLDPERAVAHLNLADALWKNGDNEEAKSYYNKYVAMMQKSGRSEKIPKRVLERIQE